MAIQARVIAFYKPYGVITAFTDAEGRPTLKKYIDVPGVYPAGRLDMDSEGLLILSDDGELIHRLTHPRHKISKTYLVQVEGVIPPQAIAALQRGVPVKGKPTRRCQALLIPPPTLPEREKPVTPHGETSWLRLTLHEGRKRQIRHMTAALGYPTLRLVRIAIGPINLEGLNPSEWRYLNPEEVARLRRTLYKEKPEQSGWQFQL